MSAFVAAVAPAVVSRIRAAGQLSTVDDGDAIIREGEVDDRLYLIEAGTVEVSRRGARLRLVGAGDVVGEFAFLDRRGRTATVRAAGPATVRAVGRQDLVRAFADDPEALMSCMSAISSRMRSRLDGTLEAADLDELLAGLSAEAAEHRAVRHRYLHALSEGLVPDLRWALADFADQYYGYSAHFPRFLTTVISRLERPEHRAGLLENLTEEAGIYDQAELDELAGAGVDPAWIVGVPHPQLFQRFRRALGVPDRDPEEDSVEVVCWREMLLGVLAGGSPAEAVGALGLGTEGVVRELYRPLVRAVARLPELHPRDTVFFPLHTAVDDHHQATLLEIARHFARTEDGRRDLAKGMRKALALRASFWDWLYERAMTGGD